VGGSISSQGSSYRNADGTAGVNRTTTATGANGGTYQGSTMGATGQGVTRTREVTGANGNTYNGQTTVSKDGITHTGGCTNASGQSIACR